MSNELLIYGEIGIDVTSTDIKTQLAQMDRDEELVVRIDSPGGSVFQGFSIHESLTQYPGPKRAVVESAAMSIASYLLTAFDDVAIAQNGYVMIHNPAMGMSDGDDEAFMKAAGDLAKFKTTMITDYASRTGKTPEEIAEMMKTETYLDANESVEAGFATEVMERPVQSRVTATNRVLPSGVRAALRNGSDPVSTATAKVTPMAEKPERTAATVSQIKAMFPKAKADFIVRCVEKEMTAEEVLEKAMEEIQSENEELKSKLAAREEEEKEAKAKAEEEEEARAKAMEEEEEAKAEEEEAKARARGNGPLAVSRVTGSRKASARVEWHQAVKECVKRGMPKARAVIAANRENPGLRERMLAEVNVR